MSFDKKEYMREYSQKTNFAAQARYQKEKCTTMFLKFSPNEKDIVDYLSTKENKSGFIKGLIRREMEK